MSAEVLILGAGPAGLLAGVELQRLGTMPLLLERGQAGESWRKMPANLRLVSPWRANHLARFDTRRFPIHCAVTAGEYFKYVSDFARASRLPLETGVTVQHVHFRSGTFEVETDHGLFKSAMVVNATGYFSRPFIPEVPGVETSQIPQAHFAQFGTGPTLRQATRGLTGRTVLVVGQRLSSAHWVPELVAAGCQVTLSHRSPLAFGPNRFSAKLAFCLLPELERFRLAQGGPDSPGFPPLMPRTPVQRWLRDGIVRAVGPLESFAGNEVVCRGGERLRPDFILWATGFKPSLSHLDSLRLTIDPASGRPRLNGFESADQPGLFFLGLDGLRDFRSRFLRGIRSDASLLARQVVAQQRHPCLSPAAPRPTTVAALIP